MNPPRPTITPVNFAGLGELIPASAAVSMLVARIAERIPHDPARGSYPGIFVDTVHTYLGRRTPDQILLLPDDAQIQGDLELDWEIPWLAQHRVVGVACLGDLSVSGDIVNRNLDGGPLLFVGGRLRAASLIKGGAPILSLGDLAAGGVILAEYNHGVLYVGGDLSAQAFVILDHDTYVRGATRAPVLNSDEVDLRELLPPELFAGPDEVDPDVERIWAWQRSGRPLLRADP